MVVVKSGKEEGEAYKEWMWQLGVVRKKVRAKGRWMWRQLGVGRRVWVMGRANVAATRSGEEEVVVARSREEEGEVNREHGCGNGHEQGGEQG